uniref:Serine/threonine-protein phosphatase 1 regulatory subunit 10 (Trinotate prediction) n=1 Tax=Henneguya salminicola TaxID=69463 RepID=A0A6G3MHQ3_HENSL
MDTESVQRIMSNLKSFLNDRGCIKSTDDAIKLIEQMDSFKSVAERALFINILYTTSFYINSNETLKTILSRFLVKGGWAALTIWFKDSLDSKHVTFLTEFIQTLAQFPITLELLKSSCIPKSLKAVAKLQHKPLQLAAKKLLISWKKYVKDTNESKNKKEIQNKGYSINYKM